MLRCLAERQPPPPHHLPTINKDHCCPPANSWCTSKTRGTAGLTSVCHHGNQVTLTLVGSRWNDRRTFAGGQHMRPSISAEHPGRVGGGRISTRVGLERAQPGRSGTFCQVSLTRRRKLVSPASASDNHTVQISSGCTRAGTRARTNNLVLQGPASAMLFAITLLFTATNRVGTGPADAPNRRTRAQLSRIVAQGRDRKPQTAAADWVRSLAVCCFPPPLPRQNNRRRENARVKTSAQCGLFTCSPTKQPGRACTFDSVLPLSLC